ncbi:fumarylacetoacetate hydrolase family protein [Marinibaculum pumilum]|uniref:Fumarylacetoacetate hydrolase family protein n=1 Tax=Marinibaculum pumilum TaxID=1766165 RepID=A0ABV7KYF5_9PROT
MKLATFEAGGAPRIGSVHPERNEVVDLAAAAAQTGRPGPFGDMLALIDAGPDGLAAAAALDADPPAAAVLALDTVRLLAPIPLPRRLRDCLVFEEHLLNSAKLLEEKTGKGFDIPEVWYRQPIYYKGNPYSVIGTGQDVIWPAYSQVMDYELELACIVGRGGADIPVEQARAHIFGLTVFNDCSARDAQADEMLGTLGPAKGKDFDTGNVLGPWIVTLDEIGEIGSLKMTARVNGEVRGGGSAGAMHHGFEQIIAYLSKSERLVPGEVIGSGTVGTGCGLEVGRYPQSGDVVELEIDRIGTLRNRFLMPERKNG